MVLALQVLVTALRAPAARGVHFAPYAAPTRRRLTPLAIQPSSDDDNALETLRARIARIQTSGLATPAQAYFDIATEKTPSAVLRDFSLEASDNIKQAMQDAVVSLFGALPTLQFDTRVTTTGDRLGALMLQLQMTGYMLRNAEYVSRLRELLNIRTVSVKEIKLAFERIDADGSGDLDISEVRKLVASFYGGSEAPEYEVQAMMDLFDTNADGKISWQEFADALGAGDAVERPASSALPPAKGDAEAAPEVTGTVTVKLDDGREIEVDAAAYMDGLREEAESLRAELASMGSAGEKREAEIAESISAYVSSLPANQISLLTKGITPEVKEAMQMVVKYILKVPEPDESVRDLESGDVVNIEQDKMRQLCFYQLVLGYRLREAEAKGEAEERLGL